MASVLQHVRASSFSPLNDDLPEGHRIHKRKTGFLVRVGARSKFAKSTEYVLSVLATGDDEAGPCEAESAASEVGEDETQRAAEIDAEAEDKSTHASLANYPHELGIDLNDSLGRRF